jgi:hypothetical protein
LGWLNEDLGAERANACVLGVEVVYFVDRMGEAGPNATGNKILEHDRLEEEHTDAAEHEDCVFSFLSHHRDPFAQDKRRTDLSKEGHLTIESVTLRPTFHSSLIMASTPIAPVRCFSPRL